jgi:imidazolonepropionase-like amidohydrolase
MRSAIVALLITVSAWGAESTTYVLKAAHLFDGASDRLTEPGIVVISGNKITAVGGQVPAGAKVIDLGDGPCCPALLIHIRI